jgi:hypothetical protein
MVKRGVSAEQLIVLFISHMVHTVYTAYIAKLYDHNTIYCQAIW